MFIYEMDFISLGFESRKDLNYWDSTGCIACRTNHNFVNTSLSNIFAKLVRDQEYLYIIPKKNGRYIIGLLHYLYDDSANNRILFDGKIRSKTELMTLLEQIQVNE